MGLGLLVAVTVVWGALPFLLGVESTIAWGLPILATVVIGVAVASDRDRLRRLLRPTPRRVVLGLLAGLVMVLATHPAFHIAARIFPSLEAWVAADYARLASLGTWAYLPRMLVVLAAEEILWRHWWLEAPPKSGRAAPQSVAITFSLATYAAVQVGLGSLAVVMLAVACGVCWVFLRRATDSLIVPLIAHAIWSPTVILFFPVGAP